MRQDRRRQRNTPAPQPGSLTRDGRLDRANQQPVSGRAKDPVISYASSGVDIEAGDRAVELFKPLAGRPPARRSSGVSAASRGCSRSRADYREPLLAASTDGVGTKLAIAQAIDKHDTVGLDLVAMVVDDLVACGAEPLFLQDYIAVGRVVPERIAAMVAGIAEGCVRAGCALLGGETAEHPGLMGPDDYDISAHRRRRGGGRRRSRARNG